MLVVLLLSVRIEGTCKIDVTELLSLSKFTLLEGICNICGTKLLLSIGFISSLFSFESLCEVVLSSILFVEGFEIAPLSILRNSAISRFLSFCNSFFSFSSRSSLNSS